MLKETLNKGISTPIAIGIILILVIIVGSFTYWQYDKIEKERNDLPELEFPEKKLDETAGWKVYRTEEDYFDAGYEINYPSDYNVDNSIPWSPSFIKETQDGIVSFSIALNSYGDIGIRSDICTYQEKKIEVSAFGEFYPNMRGFIEGHEINEENCSKLPNEYFIHKFFCLNKDLELISPESCNQISGNLYLQFYLSCEGKEYTGKEGRQECEGLFNDFVSTFKFIEEEENGIADWETICGSKINESFIIEIGEEEGLTHVAREAVKDYMNAVNIANIPNSFSLKPEEKILAEDYISKNLGVSTTYPGMEVEVSCSLVENTIFAVRKMVEEKLTQEQIDNLQSYGRSVITIDLLNELQGMIDESFPTNGIKPIIIPL